MAAVNALDKKLPLLFIGKAKKPKCFKIIKFLPCRYRNQYKSWKDGILFKEWVSDLDMKFDYGGKNVVLVIVNCPTHRQYKKCGYEHILSSKIALKKLMKLTHFMTKKQKNTQTLSIFKCNFLSLKCVHAPTFYTTYVH